MLKRLVLSLVVCACVVPAYAALKDKDKDRFNESGPVQLTRDGDKWAQKTLKKLSLEEKIGQLIMVRALAEFQNVESPAYTNLRDDIRKYHLGSVILTVRVDGGFLLRNQPYEAAMVTNRLQRDSELPLLVAADFERGLSMRLLATPMFPHAMAFGAAGRLEYAEAFGRIVALELLSRGGREFKSCEPYHQYTVVWGRPATGGRYVGCVHKRLARGRNALNGEAFSRPRRYGYRLASGTRASGRLTGALAQRGIAALPKSD